MSPVPSKKVFKWERKKIQDNPGCIRASLRAERKLYFQKILKQKIEREIKSLPSDIEECSSVNGKY